MFGRLCLEQRFLKTTSAIQTFESPQLLLRWRDRRRAFGLRRRSRTTLVFRTMLLSTCLLVAGPVKWPGGCLMIHWSVGLVWQSKTCI